MLGSGGLPWARTVRMLLSLGRSDPDSYATPQMPSLRPRGFEQILQDVTVLSSLSCLEFLNLQSKNLRQLLIW